MSFVPGSDPIQPHASTVKLTYDDLVRIPDDGKRHVLFADPD